MGNDLATVNSKSLRVGLARKMGRAFALQNTVVVGIVTPAICGTYGRCLLRPFTSRLEFGRTLVYNFVNRSLYSRIDFPPFRPSDGSEGSSGMCSLLFAHFRGSLGHSQAGLYRYHQPFK
jgi:hypothetical protein